MVGRITLNGLGPILAAAILIGFTSVAAAEPGDTDFEDGRHCPGDVSIRSIG